MTSLNRIAYIDLEGRLLTIAADGSGERLLSESNRVFQFPTWSPAAPYVAVIGSNEGGTGLYLFRDNESAEFVDPELYYSHNDVPIYHYWSPDGQQIAFLTTHEQGLALRLTQLNGQGYLLTTGQPLFWSWTTTDRLFVHAGMTGPDARLAFIGTDGDSWGENIAEPGYFQAPGTSANGRYHAFAEIDPLGRSQLVIAAAGSQQRTEIAHTGLACLSWSPQRSQLAFISPPDKADHFYGPLTLVDARTGHVQQLVDNIVFAFFWAPNGRSIVYFSLADRPRPPRTNGHSSSVYTNGSVTAPDERIRFKVGLLDVENGRQQLLTTFEPSPIFLNQIMPFFDQYALSHPLWSPDGDALVLPHMDGDIPVLLVVPLRGEPRTLAPGLMATWSPF